MATKNITASMQVRQDSATNWSNKNTVLKSGEIGYDTTNKITKIGDGSTPWKILKPFQMSEPPVIYGVRIARANSNPTTAVEYTDDAVGFTAATPTGAGSWADKFPFNVIKPCLFKSGSVVGYLNPNNYAQFADGSAADITSGAAGDIMVEFPKTYYSIKQDASYTYVRISNAKFEGFTDWAHSYKGVVRDKFYIGAYKGYINGTNLTSLSGKTITASKAIGAYRTAAQAVGAGYEITPYNKLILLQALYLIRFKSLDSQTALGRGYTGGSAAQATGATNANGIYYGTTSTTSRVKCHGIEDFWGNIYEWIDGIATKANTLYASDGNFNDDCTGYTSKGAQSYIAGYIKDVRATNDLGFMIADSNGSSATHYSDYSHVDADSGVCVAQFGGYWGNGAYAGAFVLGVDNSPSAADSVIAARLCFCG